MADLGGKRPQRVNLDVYAILVRLVNSILLNECNDFRRARLDGALEGLWVTLRRVYVGRT